MKTNLRTITSLVGLSIAVVLHIATTVEADERSSDQDSPPEPPQQVHGEMDGAAWTFATGTAKYDAEDDEYFIQLYEDDAEDPCHHFFRDSNKLMMRVPNISGKQHLAFGEQSATLVEFREDAPPMNHLVFNGWVAIGSGEGGVLDGAVSIGSGDTWADGVFEVDICE